MNLFPDELPDRDDAVALRFLSMTASATVQAATATYLIVKADFPLPLWSEVTLKWEQKSLAATVDECESQDDGFAIGLEIEASPIHTAAI